MVGLQPKRRLTLPAPHVYGAPPPMASSHFTDLKNPLARALGAVAVAGPAGLLAPVWEDVVGEQLARYSRPVRLHAGTLTVEVCAEFGLDLRLSEGLLRERLNARLGRNAVRVLTWVGRS